MIIISSANVKSNIFKLLDSKTYFMGAVNPDPYTRRSLICILLNGESLIRMRIVDYDKSKIEFWIPEAYPDPISLNENKMNSYLDDL